MPVIASKAMHAAYERGQNWVAGETERFSYRFDKFKMVFKGYRRIQPTIFARGITTMFSDSFDMHENEGKQFRHPLKKRTQLESQKADDSTDKNAQNDEI